MKKLTITKETLRSLTPEAQQDVVGGGKTPIDPGTIDTNNTAVMTRAKAICCC